MVGTIYVPVSHRATSGVYHARLGHGAFLNNEKLQVHRNPSSHPLSEFPVHFGSRFHLSGESQKDPHEMRNLGSITLELALTASGVFQYALFGNPKLWDVAAGILLVKEAGGISFFRRPGRKDWLILERFHLEQDSDSEALENLRKWSFPLVVGAPDSARKIVKDIQIHHSNTSGLASLLWHWRHNHTESGKK